VSFGLRSRPVRLGTTLIAGGLCVALASASGLGSTEQAGRAPTTPTGLAAAKAGATRSDGTVSTSPSTSTATPTSSVPTPPTASTSSAPSKAPAPANNALLISKSIHRTHTTTTTTSTPKPIPGASTANASLSFPIRAAFYYPWFPEGWDQQGLNPFTRYHPSLGFYDSSNASTVATQIRAMQYGHIQVGIASWWGQGSHTDRRVPLLLQQATGTGFKWTLYYEAGGNAVPSVPGSPNPSVTQIRSDLAYIKAHYASDPSYLHVNGKPVIFVYGASGQNCSKTATWAQANAAEGFFVQMDILSIGTKASLACPNQPDAWHFYSGHNGSIGFNEKPPFDFTVSPGFFKANESTPRLVRDSAAFTANVKTMVASGMPWQLVTSFNEWGEGTAVESAQEWASPSGYGTYLDILHANPG